MRSDGVLDVLTLEPVLAASDAAVQIGSSSSLTVIITMQCASRANTSLLHPAYAQPIRRSVIAVLAFTAGCQAFVAPQHPATGKALRAAAIEEEPEVPKYPTVNARLQRLIMHRLDP